LNTDLIRRLERELQNDSGLSAADYEVLVNLDKAKGGMRVLEMASVMAWEKGRLSKQLTRMAARGLVAREPCETDSRGAVVVLTPEGRQAFAEAEPLHLAHVRALFLKALSREQLDAMGEIAGAVRSHLEGVDAETTRPP
jgi:DNA-binding MarR family transcriptional regulator